MDVPHLYHVFSTEERLATPHARRLTSQRLMLSWYEWLAGTFDAYALWVDVSTSTTNRDYAVSEISHYLKEEFGATSIEQLRSSEDWIALAFIPETGD